MRGAAADLRLAESCLAAEHPRIAALPPFGQRVDLLEDAGLHLFGRLVGEGDGQNRAEAFGTLDDVVYVFVGQLVGLARSRAGIEYLRSHIRRMFPPKGTNFGAE